MKYPIGTKVRVVKVPKDLDEGYTPIGSIGEIIEYGKGCYKVKSENFEHAWWWLFVCWSNKR